MVSWIKSATNVLYTSSMIIILPYIYTSYKLYLKCARKSTYLSESTYAPARTIINDFNMLHQ